MSKIVKLIGTRTDLLERFQHHLAAVVAFTDQTKHSLIRNRRKTLIEVHQLLAENWMTLINTPDTKQEFQNATAHSTTNLTLEDQYLEALSHMDDLVPDAHFESTLFEPHSPALAPQIKLPPLQLKKFNGDFDDWEEFKDSFQACFSDERNKMSDCQKFLYLKGVLGEEPAALIKSFRATNNNYQAAWQILEKRYTNKRRIMSTHFRNIIEAPECQEESASNIRRLIDCANANINAIKLHDPLLGLLDEFSVFILAQKLDKESQKHWEEYLKASIELPTFEKFKQFMEIRFNVLDGLSMCRNLKSTDNTRSNTSRPNSKPTKTSNQNARSFHASIKKPLKCPICTGEHKPYQCEQIIQKSVAERKHTIEEKNLCFNCMYQHSTADCKSRYSCSHCKQRHHSLLHENPVETTHEVVHHIAHTKTAVPSTAKAALLATAKILIQANTGEYFTARALIDQGSTVNLVTENIAQRMRVPRKKVETPIFTVGNNRSLTSRYKVQITMKSLHSEFVTHSEAIVISKITDVASVSSATSEWQHIQGLQLADAEFYKQGKIDVLIGVDTYAHIIMNGLIKGPLHAPIAQQTEFGWILSGGIGENPFPSQSRCFLTTEYTEDLTTEIDERLKQIWEIEKTSDEPILSADDSKCQELFKQTTTISADGRFMVRLPFRINPSSPNFLGDSYTIALRRLHSTLSKLKKNEQLCKDYEEYINGYLNDGHIRVATLEEIQDTVNCYFMPHHAVVKESSTTTKTRIVFDASCKTTNGFSLNDRLFIGPTIQSDLFTILLRWRQFKIAFTADITKMYRQFWVHPDDAKFQRILWPINNVIVQLISLTITFGTASAPYQAIGILQRIAEIIEKTAPLASELLKNNFYVDDCAGGADSVEQAIEKFNQLTQSLHQYGLQLRKWTSNSEQFLEQIPPDWKETKPQIELTENCSIKALGLHWNPSTDLFSYSLTLPLRTEAATKRTFLSDYSMLFDPLGWLAPSLILPKILLQQIWLKGIKWDSKLPDDIDKSWTILRAELQKLDFIQINRWLGTSNDPIHMSLHGFCDASERAYAAVLYLRVVNNDGTISCQIVAAKTRVTPLKRISLPRLELCGSYLLAQLTQKVEKTLPKMEIRAYTDSKITLCWINEHPSAWACFIGNRTTYIQEIIPAANWFHVKSAENPADCASRGLIPTKLANHDMWWHGPSFLLDSAEKWPSINVVEPPSDIDMEKRSNYQACYAVQTNHTEFPLSKLLLHYSWLNQLLRGTAYLIRICNKKEWSKNGIKITTAEKKIACDLWIRIIQNHYFDEEIHSITSGKSIKSGPLQSLTPFIDEHGIIRVRGRLGNSEMPYDYKHPIILPGTDHLTWLLIRDAHLKLKHGGNQNTQHYLRQQFWIIHSRQAIKKYIRRCVACYRYQARNASQIMGQLPSPRVQPSTPFLHTGVDYAGYFEVKTSNLRNAPYVKCYIALFICLCIKAIHLELVEDLTTSAFIAAFRRFAARRGIPAHLYVDNGLYFVGARNEMPRLLLDSKTNQSQEIVDSLNNDGTQFHFIPPHAPHFGGLWEAGVKSTKYHLKRVIGNTRLRHQEFSTLLAQVEAVLNSRPLSPLTSDPNDMQVLTPGHFLIGRPLCTVPSPDLKMIANNRLDTYEHAQKLLQQFWSNWSQEYLHRLQQRPKWNHTENNIRENQIVLIKDDNLPPSKWSLGRIIRVIPGKDNLVRVVQLKTASGFLSRPITKICVLPIKDNE